MAPLQQLKHALEGAARSCSELQRRLLQMNSEDLVLQSRDHCAKVAPILKRLGILPDGYWILRDGEWFFSTEEWDLQEDAVETFRGDKLELALPEWCYLREVYKRYQACHINTQEFDLAQDIFILVEAISNKPGEPKHQATVDLICLLDENDLLGDKNDRERI